MVDQKTSLLINRQVPEFVREEHPNFIAFLEAYYEFLENKQGTQKNDLITKSKDLRFISDVDFSIASFEENFFNTYANLIPRNVEVDKAFLIKHLLPLYLSKGSEASFKLLFRLLFNEEVEVVKPSNSILRASDGKWLIENAFRVEQGAYSVYTGNGTKTTFKLAQVVSSNEISVYVNNVLQTSGFNIRKESRKLIFNTAPANNATIEVLYSDFDFNLLTNRKVTGETSGATALIERVGQKTISSAVAYELYINTKTLLGNFDNGETALLTVIDPADDTLITIRVHGLSILRTIFVIDGGASYNVGDPVIISGGEATRDAQAIVSDVFSGFINQIQVLAGGAGFKIGSNVFVIGTGSGSLSLAIDAVDVSGQNTANVFVVNTDRIADYGSIAINAANYGFNASVVTENVNSKIVDALTFENVTSIGAITNVAILFANATFASVPTLDAESAPFQANGTTHQVLSTRSLGRIGINNGGLAYQIGDELVFAETQPMSFGIGAAAAVTSISSTGAITKVELQPSRVRGTANTFGTTNVTVIGTNTVFEDDLRVGDRIMVNNESRYINTISSNTSLNVNVNFNTATTNKKIGKYGDHPIGGQNFNQSKLPTITVLSTTGSGANLSMIALMGDGENLFGAADQSLGAILKIRITDAGSGYEFPPQIDLSQSGDGTALANASVEESFTTFPGRFTTSDSLLSTSERVIQGREYYIDYSYVLSSQVEFSKFKDVFKSLVHPAGFVEYADYNINEVIAANNTVRSNITVIDTISGLVNVNSSIHITGINTKFFVAQSLGIISVGTKVAVNTEIRFISSILSNTSILVSPAFSQTANLQEMVILSEVEPLVVFTENNLPLATELNEIITL
jgi:hypothetical protein